MSELHEPKAKGAKHTVNYDISWTKNMGNFESLKINVGLSLDGYGNPTPTLNKVREFVEENLGKAVAEVTATIEGN